MGEFWVGDPVRIEWGLRLDCEKEGCDPPHSDNNVVSPWSAFGYRHKKAPPKDAKINGHACTRVKRTITYSDWEEE